ncbi:hypothetical protein [Methylobacterium sp. Leaf94]|uniref:hypothetical protein n=1 Tax=Methylobacterium sp. Leaf94 TaxID=1736250 RepID=UPI000A83FA1D|nr:hypothetical protein [Methylobacterium sp. Leaf94]
MLGGLGQLLAAFGTQRLNVYEWLETDIRSKRLPNGPVWLEFAQPRPDLQFTGWQLAHAVVKADYLIQRNFLLPGIGFLLQVDQIVNFKGKATFSLFAGSVDTLNDFVRSSLSGRLAQGMSLLFAQEKGYSFVGHLASDPIVSNHIASLPKKSKKAADFIFETMKMERMILESKGSFSLASNDPTKVKSVLKSALVDQVDYWMARIVPAATKGFAVYSCFRESGAGDTSTLIYVDPPAQVGSEPIDVPEAWVRRHNYASWLYVMGFDLAASSLRRNELRDAIPITLPIIQIAGRRFAVSSLFPQVTSKRWLCVGLDVRAMKAIVEALAGNEGSLLEYGREELEDSTSDRPARQDYSIFPDGSFFGLFDEVDNLESFETFKL